jgi:hypothetical protein
MHPPIHPDHAFVSRLQDPNSELFQTSNDRKRGFDPKSASIHSVSPSNPSDPSPPGLFSGSGHRTPDFIIPVIRIRYSLLHHYRIMFLLIIRYRPRGIYRIRTRIPTSTSIRRGFRLKIPGESIQLYNNPNLLLYLFRQQSTFSNRIWDSIG